MKRLTSQKWAKMIPYFFKSGISFFLILGLISPVFGEDIKIIHIVTPSWKNYTNEDGTGLFFDIVRSIYEPVGIKMKYEFVPWKRALMMLEKNRADAMVGAGRKEGRLMPKYPLRLGYYYALFKKENIKWDSIKSLEGKRVIWMRGYNFHTFPELLGITMEWGEVDTFTQAWKLEEVGRYDVYIDMLVDMRQYIKYNNVDMTLYQMEELWQEDSCMNFAKTEKSKKLIEIYDKRIIELFKSGELQKLFGKWDVRFSPEPYTR